jgi:hypothetical protein
MNLLTSVREIIRIVLFPVFLIFLVGHTSQVSGQPNRELEITTRLDGTAHSESDFPKFRVELRNLGARDLILNLGFTLSNGSKQYPSALVLMIIGPDRKARQFDLIGPPGVAGRMDPLVLPLPVGSTFSLPVDLGKVLGGPVKRVRLQIPAWLIFNSGTLDREGRVSTGS